MRSNNPSVEPSIARRELFSLSGLLVGGVLGGALVGCTDRQPAGYEGLEQARTLAPAVHVAFNQAADASGRAVLAETEATAQEAATEARERRAEVRRDASALTELLDQIGFAEEQAQLAAFREHFDAYETVDDALLALAVQKSNLAARRLSYGPAQEAAGTIRASLDRIPSAGLRKWQIEALKAQVMLGVREIQVLEAPHIAEASDAEMTRMEEGMSASESSARQTLSELDRLGLDVQETAAALDVFLGVNRQILDLSRRNTDVRSVALSLGEARAAVVACDSALAALIDLLSAREIWPRR